MPMTVTRQQPPTEADLRRCLATSDEVRVRNTRSGYVGTLRCVAAAYVVALTADGSAEYRIPYAHLEVLGDEGQGEVIRETSATDGATDTAGFAIGDWVEPRCAELRQARPAGHVVRVQRWAVGPQWLTVLPPDSADRWQMPSNGVRAADPPGATP